MSTETQVCVHDMCQCVVTSPIATDAYCSEYCKSQEDMPGEQNCACGHPPCDVP